MFLLAIVHTLIGAVLGLRFKVMVLVPMFAISLIAIAGVNAALGTGLWMTLIEMVIAVTSTQVGYLGGAAIRLFLAAPRGAAAERTSPNTVSRPIPEG